VYHLLTHLLLVIRNSGSRKKQKRILIIDDDPDITLALSTSLQQNGFKTDTYTDPVLVYENFRDDLYDLVLLDIKMPNDEFRLYQEIRKKDSKVKVCFLTATEFYHEVRKEHGFEEFKQDSFLNKPIETDDLIRAINKLLGSG
jgi:DNA-binding response OmpR family regulator